MPHTVRTTETKTCTDCHVSAAGDNNAVMSQLLLLGTNFVNFMGRFVFVATGHGGIEAVAVTETDEPQAVIGSDLHRLAYPEGVRGAREAPSRADDVRAPRLDRTRVGVQVRGEYVYIADGKGGFKVFDIAQLNQKGFSERIVTRAGVAARPEHQRRHARGDGRRRAVDARRRSAARCSCRSTRSSRSIRSIGYIYIADRAGRAGAVDGGDAARRQPVEQLPEARGDVQSRRAG